MISMFKDIEIIENLKSIVSAMEEKNEYKMMLYAFMLETNKQPVKCECKQGTERLKCTKCKGTGYYLVDKEIK